MFQLSPFLQKEVDIEKRKRPMNSIDIYLCVKVSFKAKTQKYYQLKEINYFGKIIYLCGKIIYPLFNIKI